MKAEDERRMSAQLQLILFGVLRDDQLNIVKNGADSVVGGTEAVSGEVRVQSKEVTGDRISIGIVTDTAHTSDNGRLHEEHIDDEWTCTEGCQLARQGKEQQ